MTVQDSATLKSYFESGDRPTEGEFIDLIDTISDQNLEFVNIKSPTYPATGDGSTDDLPNVQAAENAADNNGNFLSVPPVAANYSLDGRLTLGVDVGIEGQGHGSHMDFVDAASGGELALSGGNTIKHLRMSSGGSQIAFADGGAASDVRLMFNWLEGDPADTAVLVQLNDSGGDQSRWWVVGNRISDPGNAISINEDSIGQGAYFLANFISDADVNAFGYNQPNGWTFSDVICALNVIGQDGGAPGPGQGFAMAVAAGHRAILALNTVYETRTEAIHVEDATEGLLVLGNILDECDDNGAHFQNQAFRTFDANTDVDLTLNQITITNHKLTKDQPVEYEIGAGTAIGGLTDEARLFTIPVDDDTIQLSLTPGGAAIDLTTKPASETHTLETWSRGFITTGNWARQKDEERTDNGFHQVGDSNQSIHEQIITSNYSRGFGTGFRFGNTKGTIGRDGIAVNCTNGIRIQERNSWLCDIGNYVVRDSSVGVVDGGGGGGKIGKVTFENVTTLFQPTATNGNGLTSLGHAGTVPFSHGGTGAETVVLFPLGSDAPNSRMLARIFVHVRLVGGTADTVWVGVDLHWDGTTLTEVTGTKTSRNTGTLSLPVFSESGGNLLLSITSGTAKSLDVHWDISGGQYQEG